MNRPTSPTADEQPERVNAFFRLTAAAGAVFVITTFALVAALFGDQNAPAARFLNEHGGRLIAVEVTAILFFGVVAMTVDRVQYLRQSHEAEMRAADRDESIGPPDATEEPQSSR